MCINFKKPLDFSMRLCREGGSRFSVKAKGTFSRRRAFKKSISTLTRSSAAAAILAAGAYFSAAENAEAGIALGGSCTVSSQDFVSVTIGNILKAPDITVPITLSCDFDKNLVNIYINNAAGGFKRKVAYCFHIHNYLPSFNYRRAGPKGFQYNLPNPTPPIY